MQWKQRGVWGVGVGDSCWILGLARMSPALLPVGQGALFLQIYVLISKAGFFEPTVCKILSTQPLCWLIDVLIS